MAENGAAGARSEMLARIASALGRPGPVDRAFDPRATVEGVAREYRRVGAQDPRRLVDEFAGRAADYGAAVTLIGRDDDLAVAIARCTASGRVVAAPGVDSSWLSAIPDAARDDESRTFRDLASDGIAVTACAVAVSATGTLVLDHGPDQGRRALSLIPDHHVCVVRSGQIVATVPEAIGRLDPRRPQTWISGPSATSDIELDRVVGVHGPRRLDVIVAEDS
jgi:L-lactate dehydrogenase complex protein LldG